MAPLLEREAETWIPATEAQKTAVWQQLERLIRDPLFSHSKRYPIFLECVVRHLLLGTADGVKERLLGIEVFGRPADYDTNTDPIVRVTATEIRKRLALYYKDPAHRSEICIVLPSGSYLPLIYKSIAQVESNGKGARNTASAGPPLAPSGWRRRMQSKRVLYSAWIAAVLIMVAIGATIWKQSRPSAMEAFWAPFLHSPAPVLVCVAEKNQAPATMFPRDAAGSVGPAYQVSRPNTVVLDDTIPLLAVAGMMRSRSRRYQIKEQSITSLSDLSQGPDVLIGAFDNQWTLRLTQPLKFHFAKSSASGDQWIEDRSDPSETQWGRPGRQLTTGKPYDDYAIVARFLDSVTGQFVIVAAGLRHGGTAAVGQFLSNPAEIRGLLRRAPPGWGGQNVEAVLKTTVIGSQAGAPSIVAVHFW